MSDETTVSLPPWLTPEVLRELLFADMTTEHIEALLNVLFAVIADRHAEVVFNYEPAQGGVSRFAGVSVRPASGVVRLSSERELSRLDVDDMVGRALRDPLMREALVWLVLRLQTERDIARQWNRR